MTCHSTVALRQYNISFLGTASGLHLEKDKLRITIIRLNGLETINYKTNERKGMCVCKHTCRVSGFRDERENALDLWTYEYSPGSQVSFHLPCTLPLLSYI